MGLLVVVLVVTVLFCVELWDSALPCCLVETWPDDGESAGFAVSIAVVAAASAGLVMLVHL